MLARLPATSPSPALVHPFVLLVVAVIVVVAVRRCGWQKVAVVAPLALSAAVGSAVVAAVVAFAVTQSLLGLCC